MSVRAIAGGVVASAGILAVGWQIGAAQVAASSVAASPSTGTSSGSGSSGSSGSSGKASVSGTFQGTTAETQFGPVQVEIVVSGGKITDVKALQLTDQGGRSVEISNYAAPILRSEALSAQSSNIQSVSGATYTSDGYITSLQAAIDAAKL